MALKVKITKAEFDALPEVLKAEYKGDGAGYVLDTDFVSEDVAPLRNALDRTREELRQIRESQTAEQDRIKRETEERVREELRASGDVTGLEQRFTEERENLRREKDERITLRESQLAKLLVDDKAVYLANKLAGKNAPILLPHIRARLRAETDGETPTCRVLGTDGQVSTLTVDDLEKEFLKNELFASILLGVDSSGGGASRIAGGGASKKPHEFTAEERTELFRTNRAEFDRLFPQQ